MVARRGRRVMVDRWWLLRLLVVCWSAGSGCGDDTPAGTGPGGLLGFGSASGSAGGTPLGAGGAAGGAGGTAGTGAVAGIAGVGGSAVEPGECPTPVSGGAVVVVPVIGEDPPVIDGGGPLIDGLYYMTESRVYSGAGGPAISEYGAYKDTLVIANAASGIARVAEVVVGRLPLTQTFTMRSAGSTLEVSTSCPEFEYARYFYSYAATGDTLTILGTTRLAIYTRQE